MRHAFPCWPCSVNGAAAGWPRNEGRAKDVRRGTMRQWSRGRLAAECTSASRTTRAIPCVNGAAAGWPRNAWAVGAVAVVRVASMEPRPVGRGMPSTRRPPYINERSVNGAAAGWPRNAPGRPSGSRQSRRVNGAAAGWPRNDEAPAERPWQSTASMEPRPVGRGMQSPALQERPDQVASMEPRPVGRGMWTAAAALPPAAMASMEPRPVGRGMSE